MKALRLRIYHAQRRLRNGWRRFRRRRTTRGIRRELARLGYPIDDVPEIDVWALLATFGVAMTHMHREAMGERIEQMALEVARFRHEYGEAFAEAFEPDEPSRPRWP